MQNEIVVFLWGVSACACGGISVAFASWQRRTKDRLFGWFALAFALLGVERVVALTSEQFLESRSPLIFVLRLVAFAIIIVAIVEKNR